MVTARQQIAGTPFIWFLLFNMLHSGICSVVLQLAVHMPTADPSLVLRLRNSDRLTLLSLTALVSSKANSSAVSMSVVGIASVQRCFWPYHERQSVAKWGEGVGPLESHCLLLSLLGIVLRTKACWTCRLSQWGEWSECEVQSSGMQHNIIQTWTCTTLGKSGMDVWNCSTVVAEALNTQRYRRRSVEVAPSYGGSLGHKDGKSTELVYFFSLLLCFIVHQDWPLALGKMMIESNMYKCHS